jgi:hypothetical protein
MTRYDVRMKAMADNPVNEEPFLGRRTGLYLLELWERDVTSSKNFNFVRTLAEDMPFAEAQKKHVELLNRFNGTEPPQLA